MKKTFLKPLSLVMLILSVITISCKKDDDKKNPGESLVGTWRFTTSIESDCEDPDDAGTENCTVACFTLTFTETTVTSSNNPNTPDDYTVEGNIITVLDEDGEIDEVITFTIDGSTLTLDLTEEEDECTFVEIYTKGALIPGLDVGITSLDIPASGSNEFIDFDVNIAWTAASSETWLTVSPEVGTAKDGYVSVTAAENTTGEAREATVTITAGTITKTITVTQAGE